MKFHKTKTPTEKEINDFMNDKTPLTEREKETINSLQSDFGKKIVDKYYK